MTPTPQHRSAIYSAAILEAYMASARFAATGPAGLRPQAATRLDQRRSSHDAGERE